MPIEWPFTVTSYFPLHEAIPDYRDRMFYITVRTKIMLAYIS